MFHGLQVVHLYNEMRKLLPSVMQISYCETQKPRRPPLSKEIDKVSRRDASSSKCSPFEDPPGRLFHLECRD